MQVTNKNPCKRGTSAFHTSLVLNTKPLRYVGREEKRRDGNYDYFPNINYFDLPCFPFSVYDYFSRTHSRPSLRLARALSLSPSLCIDIMSLPLPVKITSSQDVVLAALTLFLIRDGEFDPFTTLNELEKSKAQRRIVKRLASKSSSTAAASTASLRQQPAPPRNAMPPLTFNESTRSYGSYPPQQLPPIKGLAPALIAECSEPFEKQLTKSDVCPGQARLALINEYADKLLIPKLRAWERLEDGIEVMTYGREGKQYEMIFKSWRSRLGKKMVVLTKGWKGFCEDHKMKMDRDFVTVWMFRRADADGLCFAVVSRRLSNVRHQIRRAARSREINAGMAEESTTAKRLRCSEDD